MFEALLERIAGGLRRDEDVSLRIRIFRLVCAATAVLSLSLVLPVNLLQNFLPAVSIATVLLGLRSTYLGSWWGSVSPSSANTFSKRAAECRSAARKARCHLNTTLQRPRYGPRSASGSGSNAANLLVQPPAV